MANQLLTYALVKALYDRNLDYIDTFTPFVLAVLDPVVAYEVQDIAQSVAATRSIAMPIHVVERILRKGITGGLIERLTIHKSAKGYKLTKQGERVCCSLEDEERVARRVNALLEAICAYALAEHAEAYSIERARLELLALISENLEEFARYVNPRMPDSGAPHIGGDGIVLLRYIEHARKAVPDHYETIRDMVFGSVITAVLETPSATALNEIERPLAGTVVYLDSNVIFSMLGLQSQHLSVAAHELARLMQTEGFAMRTFGFVVDETRNVLLRYARSQGAVPGNHDPESVYVQLRVRGVTQSDALEMAANLANDLKSAGIQVEASASFDLGTFMPRNATVFESLVRAKAAGRPDPDLDSIEASARVDMAAIEAIAAKRRGSVAKLEEARYIFLTRDKRLATFNRTGMGHQAAGTIPEVLLDGVLTNMLWLKNPALDVSLESIIALHSDDLLKYDALWVRFSDVVARLRTQGRMELADASALLTEQAVVGIMEERPDLSLEDVDDEMVLEEAHRFRHEFETRMVALEKGLEDARVLAEARERETSITSAEQMNENKLRGDALQAREDSLRHLIRGRARNKGLVYGALWVVPVVAAAWGVCIWVGAALDLAGVWKAILGGVVFLASSGLGWVILQHLSQQHADGVEFKMLKEHGLKPTPEQE